MKRNVFLAILVGMMTHTGWSQVIEPVKSLVPQKRPVPDSIPILVGNPLIIRDSPIFVDQKSPVAHSNITAKELSRLNTAQDIPYLLRFTPSLVSTSDAGTGVGYTGLWIRGSDPSRINVTVNNIPLNDAESQQVFWVNLPDLASSVHDIQIQRGAGPSTAGPGAFGGSIHINTIDQNLNLPQKISYAMQWGSFNSLRKTIQAERIGLGKGVFLNARLSQVNSDGYIDRASALMNGYQFDLQKNTLHWKFLLTAFGGNERTYQSWYGTPHERLYGNTTDQLNFAWRNGLSEAETSNLIQSGRTYNYYTHPNQVDQYQQHYQQFHALYHNTKLKCHTTLFHTRGAGYFEEQKLGTALTNYNLPGFIPNGQDGILIEEADVIRRRWLDNNLFGLSSRLSLTLNEANNIHFGLYSMQYIGQHFGEVIEINPVPEYDFSAPYYNGNSQKSDQTLYAQYFFQKSAFNAFADLQLRRVNYNTTGVNNDLRQYDVKDELIFFNPKVGGSYRINRRNQISAMVAWIGKEPNRNDYIDNATLPKAEYMLDNELSWTWRRLDVNNQLDFDHKGIHPNGNKPQLRLSQFSVNLFWMQYKDQLVLTGALNDVGAPLRTNIASSFRRGIELEGFKDVTLFNRNLRLYGNLTLSDHRILAYDETLYDYTNGFDVVSIHHHNTPIAFAPRSISSIVLQYNLVENWQMSWQWKYVGQQFMDNTGNLDRSLPAYQVQDLILQHTKTLAHSEIQTTLTVNNLLSTQYVSNGYTYGYIVGQRIDERFYYPQAGRMIWFGLKVSI
jgi:iron complex outermembrane receptor protein